MFLFLFKASWIVLLAGFLSVAADYGYGPPKLIIQQSGPSKNYPWIGYTHHYPRTVPRPLLLYKWDPYMDPTYSAFWVSHAHGGGYHDHGHGHGHTEGRIPHGFGHPKPSSIAGAGLGPIVHGAGGGGGGGFDSYSEEAIHPAQLIHADEHVLNNHHHAAPAAPKPLAPLLQEPVIPLVKPPHSAPLPLENEGHLQGNSIVNVQNQVHP